MLVLGIAFAAVVAFAATVGAASKARLSKSQRGNELYEVQRL